MNFTKLGVGAAASTAEGPEDGFTQKTSGKQGWHHTVHIQENKK